MTRTLEGNALVHHLTADVRTIDTALLERTGRSARTLVKDGPLRLVIIAMAAGAELPSHRTEGPVTIQVLDGDVSFTALERDYSLVAGDILVLAPEVEHAAHSASGALFLLTIVHATRPAVSEAHAPGAPPDAPAATLTEAARLRWQDDGGYQPGVDATPGSR